jgi:tetratricopeptide (TPR) repeat protein
MITFWDGIKGDILMDENTKINDMEITDEFIMLGPDVKGEIIAQNLQDLEADGVILITNDGQRVTGFIRWKEIILALAVGMNPLEKPANEIMNRDFMEVNGDETLGVLLPKISEKYPNVIIVTDSQGLCLGYFSKNDYNEAMMGLGYYDKSSEPKTPEEWRARGIAMTSQGKVEEALRCYENSLALHIDKERAWFDLGKSLEADKRYKDAILCFDRVVSMNPENEEAWMNRGNVYSTLRMPDRAAQSYIRVTKLNPENNESLVKVGLAYCDMGEIEKAISSFNSAEQQTGESQELWYWKGNAYKKAKKHEESIHCYDLALKINSNYEDAWFNKGVALYNLGNSQEAIECLQKVLKINPYNESAREALKICEER